MSQTSNDLNISQPGYVAFDGTSTFYGRTFQQGYGITLTNPDGIAGNTQIDIGLNTSSAGITSVSLSTGVVSSHKFDTPLAGFYLISFAASLHGTPTISLAEVGINTDGTSRGTLGQTAFQSPISPTATCDQTITTPLMFQFFDGITPLYGYIYSTFTGTSNSNRMIMTWFKVANP